MTRYDYVSRFREALNEGKTMSELSDEGRRSLEQSFRYAERELNHAERRLADAEAALDRCRDELADARRRRESLRSDLELLSPNRSS